VDEILRAATAAESLLRRGASEPALILYEELARARTRPCPEVVETSVAPAERLQHARSALRSLLHAELKGELAWARRVRVQVEWVISAIAVVGALAYAVALWLSPTEVSKGAHWTASSASNGPAISGELPRNRLFYSPPNFFFHTMAEHQPWVSIDLGRERVVSSVKITNRLDCCRERAREIIVDLGSDSNVRRRSLQHPKNETDFREWDVRFPPTKARFVRIRGTHDESFHLADVRIFGR
jgi:hypothetical protein